MGPVYAGSLGVLLEPEPPPTLAFGLQHVFWYFDLTDLLQISHGERRMKVRGEDWRVKNWARTQKDERTS